MEGFETQKEKMNDPKISVVNRNFVWTQLEDKIKVGDVFAFSIKERIIKNAEPGENNSIVVSEQHISQPVLTCAILVQVFDNTRVQIIDEDGVLAIIDREYFKDFIKVYDNDTPNAILFYAMVAEKMCQNAKTMNELALKSNIMCSLSKEFTKTVSRRQTVSKATKKVVKEKAKANIFSK